MIRRPLVVLIAAALLPLPAAAENPQPAPESLPAFPGAEGFGRFAKGGRAGDVYFVTNLNDSGPGSLRDGIRTAKGPRTILFRVSGTIALESPLNLKNPFLTVAGQSAPGDGITVRNYDFQVNADHVIVRFIRSRLGDVPGRTVDAFSINKGRHIMIDHCSVSWSIDECLSAQSESVELLTVQWCVVAESLHDSKHEKGPHGMGGIIGSRSQSFHHNLYADHNARNPKITWRRGCDVDFRNNVIFNWGAQSCYDGSFSNVNWVNNYYKPGPATRANVARRIFEIRHQVGPGYSEPSTPGTARFYLAGNHVVGFPEISADNWNGGVDFGPDASEAANRVHQPFPFPAIEGETSAEAAYELVLAHAGASLARDSADERVIGQVRTGQADSGRSGILNSQEEVGGWPELRSTACPVDSDDDGMPDAWEQSHGLDPQDPEDRNGDHNGDGYSNLENYLNELASPAFPTSPEATRPNRRG